MKLTPLAKGLLALIIVAGLGSVGWNLYKQKMLGSGDQATASLPGSPSCVDTGSGRATDDRVSASIGAGQRTTNDRETRRQPCRSHVLQQFSEHYRQGCCSGQRSIAFKTLFLPRSRCSQRIQRRFSEAAFRPA